MDRSQTAEVRRKKLKVKSEKEEENMRRIEQVIVFTFHICRLTSHVKKSPAKLTTITKIKTQ